jgi:hypothetical protein
MNGKKDEALDVEYRVQVAYTVPVEVIVDVRGGEVARVAVVPDGVLLDKEEGARAETTLHPVPSAVARRAIEIAEAGDWPAWEHGL